MYASIIVINNPHIIMLTHIMDYMFNYGKYTNVNIDEMGLSTAFGYLLMQRPVANNLILGWTQRLTSEDEKLGCLFEILAHPKDMDYGTITTDSRVAIRDNRLASHIIIMDTNTLDSFTRKMRESGCFFQRLGVSRNRLIYGVYSETKTLPFDAGTYWIIPNKAYDPNVKHSDTITLHELEIHWLPGVDSTHIYSTLETILCTRYIFKHEDKKNDLMMTYLGFSVTRGAWGKHTSTVILQCSVDTLLKIERACIGYPLVEYVKTKFK